MAALLAPYLGGVQGDSNECEPLLAPAGKLIQQLSVYLDLLLRWNGRTNLTAIREPEQIVTRHFGESLLLARLVPSDAQTLLDLGSGAGFPGIPIQLLRAGLCVTLAESQGKKASFLREVVRALGLPTRVHAGRAEELASETPFDVVALRAVDGMGAAVQLAPRLGRQVLLLASGDFAELEGLLVVEQLAVPGTRDGVAAMCVPAKSGSQGQRAINVPRGT